MEPKILKITRAAGVAGQYALTATVQYDDETPESVTFVGSAYGGPVVMISPNGTQVYVATAVLERIGSELSEDWVRRFFDQG